MLNQQTGYNITDEYFNSYNPADFPKINQQNILGNIPMISNQVNISNMYNQNIQQPMIGGMQSVLKTSNMNDMYQKMSGDYCYNSGVNHEIYGAKGFDDKRLCGKDGKLITMPSMEMTKETITIEDDYIEDEEELFINFDNTDSFGNELKMPFDLFRNLLPKDSDPMKMTTFKDSANIRGSFFTEESKEFYKKHEAEILQGQYVRNGGTTFNNYQNENLVVGYQHQQPIYQYNQTGSLVAGTNQQPINHCNPQQQPQEIKAVNCNSNLEKKNLSYSYENNKKLVDNCLNIIGRYKMFKENSGIKIQDLYAAYHMMHYGCTGLKIKNSIDDYLNNEKNVENDIDPNRLFSFKGETNYCKVNNDDSIFKNLLSKNNTSESNKIKPVEGLFGNLIPSLNSYVNKDSSIDNYVSNESMKTNNVGIGIGNDILPSETKKEIANNGYQSYNNPYNNPYDINRNMFNQFNNGYNQTSIYNNYKTLQEIEKENEEKAKRQVIINKMHRGCNKYFGISDVKNTFNPPVKEENLTNEQIMELNEFIAMDRLKNEHIVGTNNNIAIQNNVNEYHNKVREGYLSYFKGCEDLSDCLNSAGTLLEDIYINNLKIQARKKRFGNMVDDYEKSISKNSVYKPFISDFKNENKKLEEEMEQYTEYGGDSSGLKNYNEIDEDDKLVLQYIKDHENSNVANPQKDIRKYKSRLEKIRRKTGMSRKNIYESINNIVDVVGTTKKKITELSDKQTRKILNIPIHPSKLNNDTKSDDKVISTMKKIKKKYNTNELKIRKYEEMEESIVNILKSKSEDIYKGISNNIVNKDSNNIINANLYAPQLLSNSGQRIKYNYKLTDFLPVQVISELMNIVNTKEKKIGERGEKTARLLIQYNFKAFSDSGTNRYAFGHLYNKDVVLKVAKDGTGKRNIIGELRNKKILGDLVTDIYDYTPDGELSLFERVENIENTKTIKENNCMIARCMARIMLNLYFSGYVYMDIGTNSFKNYGYRKGFGVVLLDYPDIYKADQKKMTCSIDREGHICSGKIVFDKGFNKLICNRCGVEYSPKSLRDERYDNNGIINKDLDKGEIRMEITIEKTNGEIINIKTGKETENVLEEPKSENKYNIINDPDMEFESEEILLTVDMSNSSNDGKKKVVNKIKPRSKFIPPDDSDEKKLNEMVEEKIAESESIDTDEAKAEITNSILEKMKDSMTNLDNEVIDSSVIATSNVLDSSDTMYSTTCTSRDDNEENSQDKFDYYKKVEEEYINQDISEKEEYKKKKYTEKESVYDQY